MIKLCVLTVCASFSMTAVGADWRRTLSPVEPGSFPMLRPMRAMYGFGWSALPAGSGSFDFTTPRAEQIRLAASMKTSGFARAVFKLDAQHTAIANSSTLQPRSVHQVEVYRDKTIKSDLSFDREGVTRIRSSSVASPGNGKPKRFDFSPLFDLQSALFWIRSQPLATGDTYRLVVYPSAAPYLAEIHVKGREKIRVAKKTYPAIRLDLKLRALNKDLAVESYKKFKRATAWISDDKDRLFLKAEAEIFVGSVWAELEKVEFR